MLNHLANVSPRDGSVVGAPARGLFFEPLYGNSGAQYDPFAFTWIGSIGKDVPLCFSWHTSGVTRFEQLKTQELVVGAGGAASDSSIYPLMLNGILGTKLKVISGYDGSDGVSIAMERGEVKGYCGFGWSSIKSARKGWIEANKIHLLLQMALHKHPELPQVPLVMDLVDNDADRQALEVAFSQVEMARPIVGPRDLPAERADALSTAFEATMKDSDFLREAEKVGLEVDPMTGAEVLALVKRVYAAPKPVVERVIQLRPKVN
jgi:tripartite-type tricarboxylate transporter receptor subunit TctC